MKIAVASGKGGTGKTTVSLALAETAGPGAWLLDCDTEEPNCHLFCDRPVSETLPVTLDLPFFSVQACSGCGKCAEVCRFHALAKLGKKVLVFQEMCHACGGCMAACPEQALQEKAFAAGEIRVARGGRFSLASGVMNVGYSMAPVIIRALKRFADQQQAGDMIFDAPPGTACSMVTTVRGCDAVILVTEPTPFGLHDLQLAHRTLEELQIPCGVILNRAGENDRIIEDYCAASALPLWMKIPFSRRAASGCSAGKTLPESMPELRPQWEQLWQTLRRSL